MTAIMNSVYILKKALSFTKINTKILRADDSI